MKHNFEVTYKDVKIRQIKLEDLEYLREWRNNSVLGKYLRPIDKISPEMQLEWFNNYLEDNNIISFAIEEIDELKQLVGSVAIYDFNGVESNCGKTLIGNPSAAGRNLGFKGEVLALHVGFQKLGIEYYITEVNKDNVKSQKMTAKLGFKKVGDRPLKYGDGYEDCFLLTKDDFYMIHPELKEVKVNE